MKKLRPVSALMLAIITVFSFSACRDNSDSVVFYMPVTEDFGSLDPQIVVSQSSRVAVCNSFEGLTRIGEDGVTPEPAGADSWEISPDGLTYTFHLRKNAEWYLTNSAQEELSGVLPDVIDTRVTAADYAFGIRRALDPYTGAVDARYLRAIKNADKIMAGRGSATELGVEALGDYELKITLDYADPDFLYNLSRSVAMPCNKVFFDSCEGRYGMDMSFILCNGPYIIYSKSAEKKTLRLGKNPVYNGRFTAINDTVYMYYITDPVSVEKNIVKGEFDFCTVSSGNLGEMATASSLSRQMRNDVIWGYWFNEGTEMFSSLNMRIAFASLVDKTLVLPEDGDNGKIATSRILTDAFTPYYGFEPAGIPYDEAKALEYYRKAMAENEELDSSVSVTLLTTEDMADAAREQIQIWQRVLGLNVSVRTMTAGDAAVRFRNRNYELCLLPMTINTSGTTDLFRLFTTGNTYNYPGYMNSNYDKLVNSITANLSDDEKITKYKECEQTLISHAVVVPVFTEASYFVANKSIAGLQYVSDGEIYFNNARFS
ncbi:MAG: peptide ABC transporter substrate-binding protein [Clostridia bacterium]|nr:peptide ABC transporter substrate-binding protein [Clostridia bacterium]